MKSWNWVGLIGGRRPRAAGSEPWFAVGRAQLVEDPLVDSHADALAEHRLEHATSTRLPHRPAVSLHQQPELDLRSQRAVVEPGEMGAHHAMRGWSAMRGSSGRGAAVVHQRHGGAGVCSQTPKQRRRWSSTARSTTTAARRPREAGHASELHLGARRSSRKRAARGGRTAVGQHHPRRNQLFPMRGRRGRFLPHPIGRIALARAVGGQPRPVPRTIPRPRRSEHGV